MINLFANRWQHGILIIDTNLEEVILQQYAIDGNFRVPCISTVREQVVSAASVDRAIHAFANDDIGMRALEYRGLIVVSDCDTEMTTVSVFVALHVETLKNGYRWASVDQIDTLLPQTEAEKISTFLDRERLSSTIAHIAENAERKIERGIGFLDDCFRTSDSENGWAPLLDTASVGSLATSIGVLSHVQAQAKSPFLEKAKAYIVRKQNQDGGWPVRSTIGTSEESVAISTLFALWALLESGVSDLDAVIENGNAYLSSLQLQCGAFTMSCESDISHFFATCFAVRILNNSRYERKRLKEAINWVARSQNRNGGWSAQSGEISTSIHTAHALLALMADGSGEYDVQIRLGVQWLLSSESGIWQNICETTVLGSGRGMIQYNHMTIQWVVIALLRARVSPFHERVVSSISTVLGQQREQGWFPDGLTLNHPTVWALHDTVYMLNTYMRALPKVAATAVNCEAMTEGIKDLTLATLSCVAREQHRANTLYFWTQSAIFLTASFLTIWLFYHFFINPDHSPTTYEWLILVASGFNGVAALCAPLVAVWIAKRG